MFRTLVRLEKFIKTKNYVYEDHASVKTNLAKTYVVGMSFASIIGTFIYQFCTPTPEVMYDIRLIVSPEFYQFAKTNGTMFYDVDTSSAIRGFKYDSEHAKECRTNTDYRGSFIEMD
uniref:Transmembrane protein n=1 Tax=Panagrellus redivivus TaxID=6233 RepID=A0A7E4ZZN2_PANRE